MMPGQSSEQTPFPMLRSLVRSRTEVERCELCSLELGPEHPHLVEPSTRRLLCACDACAVLFSGGAASRYRRVPRRIRRLPDFVLTDEQWDELHLPINLAFFFHNSPQNRVVAIYPSPAGPTESALRLESWQQLEEANPLLRQIEPDVEALLVNRLGDLHEYYMLPIDVCYKLIGLIRTHWRGFSGGTEMWDEIARFFANLQARSEN